MILGDFLTGGQRLSYGTAYAVGFGELIARAAVEGEKFHHRRRGGHRLIQPGVLLARAVIRGLNRGQRQHQYDGGGERTLNFCQHKHSGFIYEHRP